MSDEPKYTTGEEFANATTHALGAILAIAAIVILTTTAKTPTAITATAIYGTTMFLLFQSSTCYHALTNKTAKKVFRRIDHSAIFLLIAGTYTPLLLLAIPFPLSVILLAIIWYLSITGIVFSCLTLKFKYISTGLYLLLSWLSVFLIYTIWINSSHLVVWYFLAGGLFYTFGCIFYLLKKKYMHSIWHMFVLVGAVLHYFAIMELLKVS